MPYPEVARVVEDACREFGVNYREHRTFATGIASHYRWLRRLDQPVVAVTANARALLLELEPLPQT